MKQQSSWPSRLAKLCITLPAAALMFAACASSSLHPVATFEVAGGETFKIELATPELLEHAEELLDGAEIAAIPLGTVIRDEASVNDPWSWHIDPATLEFAEVTITVCDGLPSQVEDGTLTSDEFCPWSAKIVSIDR